MRRLLLALLILLGIGVGLIQLGYYDIGPVVITREDQQKVVYLLQKPREKATEPGYSFRLGVPFLEQVKTFDRDINED